MTRLAALVVCALTAAAAANGRPAATSTINFKRGDEQHIAAGMTFVILTGGIDLSVGSVLAASAMVAVIASKLTGALGLLGIADPVRPTAAMAVSRLLKAGVQIIMITGDHPSTAEAIAAELGVSDGQIMTGAELDALEGAPIDVAT